eukprot:Rhum_TRINITY_DN14584_c13_g10::Rhum_TRINITY_DN14584_c13_g10_i1::g.99728::m.99728
MHGRGRGAVGHALRRAPRGLQEVVAGGTEGLVRQLVEGERAELVLGAQPPPLRQPEHRLQQQRGVRPAGQEQRAGREVLAQVLDVVAGRDASREEVARRREDVCREGDAPEAEVELHAEHEAHRDGKPHHDEGQCGARPEQHLAERVQQGHVRGRTDGTGGVEGRVALQRLEGEHDEVQHRRPHADRRTHALVGPVVADRVRERGAEQQDAQQGRQREQEPRNLLVAAEDHGVHGGHEAATDRQQDGGRQQLGVAAVADQVGRLPHKQQLQGCGAHPEQRLLEVPHVLRVRDKQDREQADAHGQRRDEVRLHRVLHLRQDLAGVHDALDQDQDRDEGKEREGDVRDDLPDVGGTEVGLVSRQRAADAGRLPPGKGKAGDAQGHHRVGDHDVLDGVEVGAYMVVRLEPLDEDVGRGGWLARLGVQVLLDLVERHGEVVDEFERLFHHIQVVDVHVVHPAVHQPQLDHEAEEVAPQAHVEERLQRRRPRQTSQDHRGHDLVPVDHAEAGGCAEAEPDEGGKLLLGTGAELLRQRRRQEHGEGAGGREAAAADEADEEVEGHAERHPGSPRVLAEDDGDDGDDHHLQRDHAHDVAVHGVREVEEPGGERGVPLLLAAHPRGAGRLRRGGPDLQVEFAALLELDQGVASADVLTLDEDDGRRLVPRLRLRLLVDARALLQLRDVEGVHLHAGAGEDIACAPEEAARVLADDRDEGRTAQGVLKALEGQVWEPRLLVRVACPVWAVELVLTLHVLDLDRNCRGLNTRGNNEVQIL